jgi:anti-sigma factor RsiW
MMCREVIGFLADYLDGALPPEVAAEFEEHLAECDSCVAYLASYRETILAARVAVVQKDDLLDDAPEELIEAILQSRPR